MPVKRNINVSDQYIHIKIKTGYKKTKMLFQKAYILVYLLNYF